MTKIHLLIIIFVMFFVSKGFANDSCMSITTGLSDKPIVEPCRIDMYDCLKAGNSREYCLDLMIKELMEKSEQTNRVEFGTFISN